MCGVDGCLVKTIQNYEFSQAEQIGKGFSSSVYKGYNQKKEPFAIKVINLHGLKESTMQVLLQSEISVLKKLSHDNVLKCQDIFITINNCYIISELCGDGDLASLLKKKGRLRGVEALNVMTGIIDGYLYLQSLDILHRDLKPANIFMSNGQVKIGDFGFACYQKGERIEKFNIGTPLYMSPETLFRNTYTKESDIWAIGVIFYEILQGRPPWDVCTEDQLRLKLQNYQDVLFRIAILQQLEEMIKRCLTFQKSSRITGEQIKRILEQVKNTMQGDKSSPYRNSLTIRPSHLAKKRVNSNSTMQTMQKTSIRHDRNNSNFSVLGKQNRIEKIERKKTFEDTVKRKQSEMKVLINSTNQKMKDQGVEQASRYNYKLLKTGINFARFIYKLYPRIDDLYCPNDVRKKIKFQLLDSFLLPLISKLKRSLKSRQAGEKLIGLQQFNKFSKTICYGKTVSVIQQYFDRYTKLAQKQYKIKCIRMCQELAVTRVLKSLVGIIPLDDNTPEKHNICVDFLLSLIVLMDILSTKKMKGLADEGYLQEILGTEPEKLESEHISELIVRRDLICTNN